LKKRVALIAAFAAVLSLNVVGPISTASACPDPDNPCDIQPYEIPGWCKLTPFC
jgi:hypothetical protein